jgi:hypothetical protein
MSQPDRRDFILGAAAGIPIVGAALASEARADEPADPLGEAARLLAEAVRARHGKRIDEASFKSIQQKIRGQLSTGDVLKRVPIANSDEPDFTFQAEVS